MTDMREELIAQCEDWYTEDVAGGGKVTFVTIRLDDILMPIIAKARLEGAREMAESLKLKLSIPSAYDQDTIIDRVLEEMKGEYGQ